MFSKTSWKVNPSSLISTRKFGDYTYGVDLDYEPDNCKAFHYLVNNVTGEAYDVYHSPYSEPSDETILEIIRRIEEKENV